LQEFKKMKIDIFAHILPENYVSACKKKYSRVVEAKGARNRATVDLEIRLRLMNRYPDVVQVLTLSNLSLETLTTPEDGIELARIANDGIAELVVKYPDKFVAGVACLPMNNLEAAAEETERAITKLGLKGVMIYAKINGTQLDDAKFKPLYKKMAQYDLPIWIHPASDEIMDEPVFGWPFATANAMRRLVSSGIFNEYPDIKFITHHCGAMAPYFEGRIKWLQPLTLGAGHPVKNPAEHYKKFYNDTATYGTGPAIKCGYDFFGADRILFGTDAPLGPQYGLTEETIRSIEMLDIPGTDKEKIFSLNAIKLLKIAI
jgi:predicted TIM-barrel fold metal-dependent hydrolase